MNLKDSILLFSGSVGVIVGAFFHITHMHGADFFFGLGTGITIVFVSSIVSKQNQNSNHETSAK